MLKRLLGRSILAVQEPVAQVAQPKAAASAVGTPGGAQVAKKKAPAPYAPKIRKKRKTTRSRASDIIDESGRSAEEIAAEANKDFDIMAVARRAADLPETGVAPKKPVEAVAAAVIPAPAPVVAPAAAAPAPAPAAQPDPAPVVEEDSSDPGHIVMPGADADAAQQTQDARDAYWSKWGGSDDALIGYDVNPQSIGAPAWPATRQNFRLVRTVDSLVIASEGLSDPFGPFSGGGTTNGFGMEVFMEIPGWQEFNLKEVKNSWAFMALEHFARVSAQAKGIVAQLEANRVLSMDLPHGAAPAAWLDPDFPEMPGGLIGLPLPPGFDRIADAPLSDIRIVPLTLLTPEELEAIIIGGADDRRALVDDLMTTGIGHRTMPDRISLR